MNRDEVIEKSEPIKVKDKKYMFFWKNLKLIIVKLWILIFGISKSDNVYHRILKTSFLICDFIICIISLVVIGYYIYGAMYNNVVVVLILLVIHSVTYVVYLFFRKIWFMSVSVTFQIMVIVTSIPYVGEYKGVNNFLPTCTFLVIVPLFNIALTDIFFFHLYPFVFVLIIDVVLLVLELVLKFEPMPITPGKTVAVFITIFTLQFSVNCVTLLLKRVVIRERKLLEKLTNLIANLDFDNKFVDKILKKKDYQLSSILVNFRKILCYMKQYKSYLPASLYKQYTGVNCERRTSNDSCNSENSSLQSETKSISNNSSGNSVSMDLLKKKVVLMIVKVFNFEKYGNIKEFHKEVTKKIENVAKKYKGILHHFNGFYYIIGFDIISRTDFPEEKACLAALKCKKEIKDCYITVTKGSALYGNLGTESNKRFCVFGDPLKKCNLLSLNQENKEIPFPVIIDCSLQEVVKFTMKLKPISLCSIGKVDSLSDLFLIYSLVSGSEKKTDEWNYQIKQFLEEDQSESNSWDSYKLGKYKKVTHVNVKKKCRGSSWEH